MDSKIYFRCEEVNFPSDFSSQTQWNLQPLSERSVRPSLVIYRLFLSYIS